jgi:hypothetical protein
MEVQIPQVWRESVIRILRTGRFGKEILVTTRVFNEWEAQSLGAFPRDVCDPIIAALSDTSVTGRLIVGQLEPGVTYAFWFFFQAGDEKRKFYGKICLYEGGRTMKLLSAHLPNHGDERL